MIFNEKMETMPRDELEQLQIERLQSNLNRVYRNVKFYKNKFDEYKVTINNIKKLTDLTNLPFTTKDDLRGSYPYGMLAVPLREIVRIHASSGTTGLPTVVGYTKNDLKNWTEMTARLLTAAGVTKDDVVQVFFNYGLFTGGFGLHYGLEKIGASVIPASSGNTKRQIYMMKDYKTTVVLGTPSYMMHIIEVMEEMKIFPSQLSLKTGVFGAEPWTENMRKQIENRLRITATDNYGLSELLGPGIAGECVHKTGLHINEDHFIVEIIDTKTGEYVEPGETGELVLTSITKEGMPLIRFKTGDITKLISEEKCECGRTFKRIDRISGRNDDMLIIRGVNVFPSQIENVLLEIEGTEPHYQIILEKEKSLDKIQILVEVSEKLFFDTVKKMRDFQKKIETKLKTVLGLTAEVKLVEPKTIKRTEGLGKTNRVVDKRSV